MRVPPLALACLIVAASSLAGCMSEPAAAPADARGGSDTQRAVEGPTNEAPTTAAKTGYAAHWSLTASDATVVNASDFEGKATAVFFMATWCTTCQEETKALKRALDEVPEAAALTVSIERSGDTDAQLEKWKATHDQPWPHARDTASLTRDYKIPYQSWIIVLDGNGNESWRAYTPSTSRIVEALRAAA